MTGLSQALRAAIEADPLFVEKPSPGGSKPGRHTRTHLTTRERQVLHAVAAGLTASEIGSALYLAEDSVKTHLRSAYRFLGARNAAHAVTLAHLAGELPARRPGTPPLAERTRVNFRKLQPPRQQPAEVPVPPEVYILWPSCTWGEKEWVDALADPDLVNRLIDGIGVITRRHMRTFHPRAR